jgi:hypothetical protein
MPSSIRRIIGASILVIESHHEAPAARFWSRVRYLQLRRQTREMLQIVAQLPNSTRSAVATLTMSEIENAARAPCPICMAVNSWIAINPGVMRVPLHSPKRAPASRN